MLHGRISTFLFCRILAVIPVVAALWMAVGYPLGTVWALVMFLAATAVFYFTKDLWISALPVILVIGDLYPWTGRLLWSEADGLLMALVAVRLWEAGPQTPLVPQQRTYWLLWTPFLILAAISCFMGWHDLPAALSGDELSIYSNHWNSVRVAKGCVWGFILANLLFAAVTERADRIVLFARGVQASALVVGVLVVLERAMSVGLLNRDELYRATGPFVSMHTGGQHIDAFWAMALPFVFLPLSRRTWLDLPARGSLLVLSYYAIAATMSRGIIVLAGIETVVLVALSAFAFWKDRPRWQAWVFAGLTILFVVAASKTVLENDAIKHRFTKSSSDLAARWDLWRALCRAADQSWPAKLLGNGLGTVPSIASLAFHEPLRTAELVSVADGRVALRIRPGKAVYVEQVVHLDAAGPWKLQGLLRTDGRIDLHSYVCQKSLFDSFRCTESSFGRSPHEGEWLPFTWIIDTKTLLPPESPWQHCPVTLAFSASNDGKYVDIADLQLTDASGQSLLLNCDFQSGTAHWFFTSDDHSKWRAENMWVHLYLELGWFGVASFAWLLVGTLVPLAREAAIGRDFTLCVLGVAIVGFLAMGVFGAMLETPWTTELFFSLLAVSQAKSFRALR